MTGNDDVSALTATVNEMLARIEGSLRAQGQLLDDVRHELNTPVTIVRGHLELLDASNPNEVDDIRVLVIDELDRMVTLIDDIELLASSTALQLVCVDTDITELSQQIFEKCRAIPGHQWSLRSGTGTGTEDTHVWIDPARITQAMLQLADNAAKYSPDGSAIEIGYSLQPDTLRVWVSDHGPGIPLESQPRIFERFGRVDTGRGISGSGLGLPIVEAIARAHGGNVDLVSSPAGSRFSIIMLTARTSVSDTVQGLDAGANDYIPKPFKFDELLARVRVRLREVSPQQTPELVAGELELDVRTRRATINGRTIELSAREFALAEEFVRNHDQVLSREQLLSRVWGYDFDPGSNVVDVYVRYLRGKLGADRIETVRGMGYRLR